MRLLYYFAFLFMIVNSCSPNTDNSESEIEQIEIDINKKTKNATNFNHFFELKKYITLKSSSSTSLISSISSILYGDDRIFIADDNEKIFIYDTSGYLLNLIEPGKGPGQYMDLLDIQYDFSKKELYAWSLLSEKMYIYDENGNFKRKFHIPIPIYKFYLINENELLCYTNFAVNKTTIKDNSDKCNQLYIISKEGNQWRILYENLAFSKRLAQQLITWSNTSYFFLSDIGIIFCPPYKNKVYLFDSIRKQFSLIKEFDFGVNKIPTDFFDKEGTSNLFKKLKQKEYIHGWENFYFNKGVFCFTTGFDDERTVIYDMNKGQTAIFRKLKDVKNELTIHLLPNLSDGRILLAYTNPDEIKSVKTNSIAYQIKQQVDEFGNPILLFYKLKN